MKSHIDYSHPLAFFGVLILFSIIGYQMEKLMGMGAFITFVVWAVLTGYVLMRIQKQQLPYNHPATFFALIITFTITGYYISSVLNAESYILLVTWLAVTYLTLMWLKQNDIRFTDKRLFYLLSIQFVALAFIIPVLLQYVNLGLLEMCQVASKAVESTSLEISRLLLSALGKTVWIISLVVGIYALRLGLKASHPIAAD